MPLWVPYVNSTLLLLRMNSTCFAGLNDMQSHGCNRSRRSSGMPAQERERVHWEEQRKAMQADQYNKAELARFEDELARKRADVEHDKHRARQVELVRSVLIPHLLLLLVLPALEVLVGLTGAHVCRQVARGELCQSGGKEAGNPGADRGREARHRAVQSMACHHHMPCHAWTSAECLQKYQISA